MTHIEEQQAFDAFHKLEHELAPTEEEKLAGFNLGTVCKKYETLRPTIETALKVLGLFPFVGKGVVQTITFLMSIADNVCATPAPAPPVP